MDTPNPGHPLLWLALLTFVIVIGIAVWSLLAVKRRQKFGRNVSGIGSKNDPMAGS